MGCCVDMNFQKDILGCSWLLGHKFPIFFDQLTYLSKKMEICGQMNQIQPKISF